MDREIIAHQITTLLVEMGRTIASKTKRLIEIVLLQGTAEADTITRKRAGGAAGSGPVIRSRQMKKKERTKKERRMGSSIIWNQDDADSVAA